METIQDNTNLSMSPEENQSILNNNSNQLKNLNILVNGIKLAQKRGAFEVHESAILWDAISGFLSEKPDTTELLN